MIGLFFFFRRFFRSERLPETIDHLFFGLGNPGPAYAATRHNIGYRVAQALAERLDERKDGEFGEALFSSGRLFGNTRVLVVRPVTFMNRSGEAVQACLDRWRLPLSRVMVMVDDYQLPLGKLRARRGGSDGGHNGLKSISARIGDGFPRLRVGIGPVAGTESTIDFVLGAFTGTEKEKMDEALPRAVDACLLFAEAGIEAVMNRYNG